MKKTTLLHICILLAATGLTASSDTNQPTIRRIAVRSDDELWERVDAKVVKVYSAQEGDAKFRAYAVNWKGQEIIVTDPHANSLHKEGDTISVWSRKAKLLPEPVLWFSMWPRPESK